MIKDIKNDFEREVYIKYITYMEIPDCAESYDMFFRDALKTNRPNITSYLNPELYTPFQIEEHRVINNANAEFLETHFIKFNEIIPNICIK